MCGIVAYFAPEGAPGDGSLVSREAPRLRHRGPDGQGTGTLGRASVGHTRLAIVDLEGGEQPMRDAASSTLLVCNGEIYNHEALRSELGAARRFNTRSDSEVILHLYAELGERCLGRLDGMFAFFVSDGESFLAARDPFGIKPLYYGRSNDGGWVLASETKIVAGSCRTFASLAPGSLLTQSGRCERWFRPAWETQVGERSQVTPGEVAERLRVAVVKRLMSDVPLGVFLSGGLDSSIVAELTAQSYEDLATFSVGTPGASDLEAARIVARALGTRHFERVYSAADAVAALPEVIGHLESYDAALIRSAIPCYFLSSLAAQHVKIVLTGEGADELFGGYGYFSRLGSRTAFHRELVRLLFGLHGMNLQRVDRMTMAHGLEGRVPFLDAGFVDFAMSIDPALKMWDEGTPEKALLRAAFADRLPSQILERKKLEFSRGSGAETGLAAHADERISDADLKRARTRFPVDTPSTKEELLYREIFEELFPGEVWRAGVSRWRPTATPERGSIN